MFSEETKTLCFDVAKKKLVLSEFQNALPEGAMITPDEAIRRKFYEALGVEGKDDRRLANRLYTRNREICELLVEIVETIEHDEFMNSPFFQKFVETKHINWGDTAAFLVDDDSLFRVSTFSGGHWDTDRQKVRGNKPINVPVEAYYVHVYDELINFLVGRITFERLINKVTRSINHDLHQRIFANFMNSPALLPGQFVQSGVFNPDNMVTLCETVRTATGGQPVIVGTSIGLNKIVEDGFADPWVSDDIANEYNNNGILNRWRGYELLPIPAAFTPGTFDFDPNVNKLFILANRGDMRFIKVVNEGTPLIRDTRAPQGNQDQTLDYQIQYYMGVATVFPSLYGVYTIA